MCKCRKLEEFAPPVVIETDMSIAITWPDELDEGEQWVYTVTITQTGVIGAEDVEVTATLPAWVDYVSSTGGGSESSWVITWTVGDVRDWRTATFTVESATADTYELDVAFTTSTVNVWTPTSDSIEVEVVEPPAWSIEVRVNAEWWDSMFWPENVWTFTLSVNGNILPLFTLDIAYVSWTTRRLWYYNWTLVAQDVVNLNWTGSEVVYENNSSQSYNGTDMIWNIDCSLIF